MRPGWGVRHPAFADIVRSLTPLAAVTTRWAAGTLPLRITAYMPLVELPHELVVSVRCLVTVDDALLMCVNADGTHPWPGGRREPGETFSDTASREVHEETGWILDPDSLRPLGWLHLEHLARPPEDYQYPHPDFLSCSPDTRGTAITAAMATGLTSTATKSGPVLFRARTRSRDLRVTACRNSHGRSSLVSRPTTRR